MWGCVVLSGQAAAVQGCTLPILCLLMVGVAVKSRDAVVEELEGLYSIALTDLLEKLGFCVYFL